LSESHRAYPYQKHYHGYEQQIRALSSPNCNPALQVENFPLKDFGGRFIVQAFPQPVIEKLGNMVELRLANSG
jgi:hypothetical protein